MRKYVLIIITCLLVLIPLKVYALDDFSEEIKKNGKSEAIDRCMTGSEGEYKCYRYTHLPKSHPMYNTTVWSNKSLECGFELVSEWGYDDCKDASLNNTYEQCKGEYCRHITHSGYNGTPDFYNKGDKRSEEIVCGNLKPLHIVYRLATIIAPIMVLFFTTYDLIASIMSGDPKRVSKIRSKIIRRLIALFLLLIIPVLIKALVGTLSRNEYIKDTKYIKCIVIGND